MGTMAGRCAVPAAVVCTVLLNRALSPFSAVAPAALVSRQPAVPAPPAPAVTGPASGPASPELLDRLTQTAARLESSVQGLAAMMAKVGKDAASPTMQQPSEHDSTTQQPSPHADAGGGAVPPIVSEAFRKVAADARAELVKGSQPGAAARARRTQGWVFSSVWLSLPVSSPVISRVHASQRSEMDKSIVGTQVLGKDGRKCVVYGMGIAWESNFEQQMAREGCETHAFDCTIMPNSPAVANQPFTFHEWCIGPSDSKIDAGNAYLKGGALKFKTFAETMETLGHSSVDLLKFDIEGFEWDLFESTLLVANILPAQLSFELHTEGANPGAVQPRKVNGKSFEAVNRLFLQLFDLGYRVVSKELNPGDQFCCEFVLVNVGRV
mmetsp:Transcript_119970/g.333838  ORF Transcript_119970/g.333838 Transcript_119970/m.333838 type:complete len:381 (+) Transcript_119970:63-1205(+)